ncbi:MAG: GTPase HflX [Peptococcaceae bacterium]|nr:GTPase HflX [Peptococcaceae bacterium]
MNNSKELDKSEKVVLVGIELTGDNPEAVIESMKELARLAQTAGGTIVGQLMQKKEKPSPATFLGKGKAQEAAQLCLETEADVLICDRELSSTQTRNLEEITKTRVIDRSRLILDIFALGAKTREGKLQVELAQINYLLPRLTGQGLLMSRLGGGIGTRGPGETKLEMDRRRIRKRIVDLKKTLEEIKCHRRIIREGRTDYLPQVSIVGYTNSGKSTLLNMLTGSEVLAEDKLFATLDTTTRSLLLPNNEKILITDTVGFINNLPHHLVAAFRATLEELQEADLLLHIIDSSHPNATNQEKTVIKVLESLGAGDKPIITVYNKSDLLEGEYPQLSGSRDKGVFISAVTGYGIDGLLQKIASTIERRRIRKTFFLSFANSNLLKLLYDKGKVIKEEHLYQGLSIEVEMEEIWANKVEALLKAEKTAQIADK